MDERDLKEIACPFHGDEMIPTEFITYWNSMSGAYIKGKYRARCGCCMEFDTGTLWVMKPQFQVEVTFKS